MSKDIDIEKYTSEDITTEKLSELIAKKASFQIVAVKNISSVVNKVEGAIEKKGLRCRVYTEYRAASLASFAIPTGFTQVTGFASVIGIAAHNLATFNPDYEIGKNKPAGKVTVLYKKD
ncbi:MULTISPECIES: hypothetical protein [Alcanivorax]|jgi:hypothetical protein|uniref:hypothetical protein n=1 Tax=Alcanivorax TaxID=59753 RepID=UPI0007BA52EF|nr:MULTISPECIES: hypothetical protein [unclassified Alcanivorax]KZX79576.1 hypothetical protein A3716_00885 [Alcanivorax sp. HI0011]KZX80639.1 hypothetical protein A3717_39300 [Alcanivorax sp. HI0013]KZY15950.1 hypothetical protein A3725_39720 [Alcanivorax sp. HI0035]KZX69371.1 hypothetical protein A3713_15710 [Alcanivorax sp. HI0003]KZX71834.1 hypothetical protein A3714_04400 [Alcanivorax sp. HI0007]|tara:strand:- start:16 stop:372 length:357 start_codon:yes stop_codon:yes gene_type:complete